MICFVFFFFFLFITGARQTPVPNIDIIEREEEGNLGFDYGTVVPATHDIFVKFFEKESEAGYGLAANGIFFATFNGFFGMDIAAHCGAILATVYGLIDMIFEYLCAPHIGACLAIICGLILAPIGVNLATAIGLFGGLNGFIFEAPTCAIDTTNIGFHELLLGAPQGTFDTTSNNGIGFEFLGVLYTRATEHSENKDVFEMELIGSIIKINIRQVYITFVLSILTTVLDFN